MSIAPPSTPAAVPETSSRSVWFDVVRANAWLVPTLLLLWPIGFLVEREDGLDPYVAIVLMLIGINIILAVSLQLINGISGQFSLGHAGFMAVGAYFAGYPTTSLTTDFDQPGRVMLFFAASAIVALLSSVVLFAFFAIIRASRRAHSALPGVLFMALIVWIVTDVARARDAEVIGWATAWPRGFALLGELFGWVSTHGAGLADGFTQALPDGWVKPLTFGVALLGGGVCAAVAGLIVGLPTLRLRGDYLAIATLGFAEIIRVAFNNIVPFGQARGMSLTFYANLADPAEGLIAHYILPWIFGTAIITIVVIWRLKNSPKGRAIRAVAEDEIAAGSLGIDPTHHKVLSFVTGAFFAGLAGGLYAHYIGFINPDSFTFMQSVEIVVMVTLGGLGSIRGAVIAAVLLTFLPEFLRSPSDWIALAAKPLGVEDARGLNLPQWLVATFAWIADKRMVIYALLLIVVMLVRAKGLPRPIRWLAQRRKRTAAA